MPRELRLFKSSFEAAGLRISSHSGNTGIHALDLSIKHSWSQGSQAHETSLFSSRKWDCWSWWSLPALGSLTGLITKRTDLKLQRRRAGILSTCNKCSIDGRIKSWFFFISFQTDSENLQIYEKNKISPGNPFPYSSLAWSLFSIFASSILVRKKTLALCMYQDLHFKLWNCR